MKEKILERKVIFNNARENVKSKFYGIDEQIDKIFDSISAWYLAPEIMNRPTIVNLWGMTGVGKTSVIREIVSELKMSERYMELQMGEEYKESINEMLQKSSIVEDAQGVILLDEFQRFRKIDENGHEIKTKNPLDDVWMLLSDGKYPFDVTYNKIKRFRDLLHYHVIHDELDKKMGGWEWGDEWISEYDGKKKNRAKFKSNNIRSFNSDVIDVISKYLKIDGEDLEKFVHHMNDEERCTRIDELFKKRNNAPLNYSKCLIFISGNLDEAFSIANDVNDCDTEADAFHDYTKKVTVMKIKDSLKQRFTAEQIARFGNDHIVYPSLSKVAYQQIIKSSCDELVDNFEKSCNIKIEVDENVYNTIYENSVYPTQGTRPVFSTISKIFNSTLSRGVLWAIENNYDKILMTLDIKKSKVVFHKDFYTFSTHVDLDISNVKNKYSLDFSSLLAVHEIGHAIVYSDLFHDAPRDIKINAASFNGGFNMLDNKANSKKSLLNTIATMYGGVAAEEIVFGTDNRSEGCKSDIQNATIKASNFVRRFAMNGINGCVHYETSTSFIRQTDESDTHIEEILNNAKKEALNILNKHKTLMVELSKELLERKSITKDEFKLRCKDVFEFKESSDDIHGDYHNILMNLK